MISSMATRVTRWVHWIHWYVREYSGAGAYDRHVDRYRVEHPGSPVPSRGAYERDRARHRDRHPASRCC